MLKNQLNLNNSDNKIKIVYIMPTLEQGGAERALVDLLLNLDLNTYSPSLILFKGGGLWLKELAALNISIIVLHKKWKIDFSNFLAIIKNLKKIRPLIVHTQLGGDLYGRLAAKIIGVPIIISTEQNINFTEGFLQNLIKKFTNRLADKIVAITEAVKKDLVYRYQVSENKIKVIPNGVNLNKFLNYQQKPENKKELENQKIILGTIGRLVPQKGQSILIKALAKIKDLDFECLIAGQGPLEDQLNRQIKDLNLDDRIKLVGTIKEVPEFLSSLDAFIFPSLWEGQGVVLLEAALMNLPIIASDVNGIKEVLNNETAYLVKPADVHDLAAKISWLINNLASAPVKARTLKLKEEIKDKFSSVKMAEDYQKLYQELLDSYENTAS